MRFAYKPHRPEQVEWIDIDVVNRDDVFNYVQEDERVYDCDGGGRFDGYFAFKLDGVTRYFKYHNDYGWADWHNENRHVYNEFTFTEVTAVEAQVPSERDWLDLTQRSYPETNIWPPLTLPAR